MDEILKRQDDQIRDRENYKLKVAFIEALFKGARFGFIFLLLLMLYVICKVYLTSLIHLK